MKLFEIKGSLKIKWPSNKEEVKQALKDLNLDYLSYKINDDLTVDFPAAEELHVTTEEKHLPLQFGTCDNMILSFSPALTTLDGCPKIIKTEFIIKHCDKLMSLEGAPQKVEYFHVKECNSIVNLLGLSKLSVLTSKGDDKGIEFYKCNKLNSLKGLPNVIKCPAGFTQCKSLTNFETFPREFHNLLDIQECGFKSLAGLSQHVKKIKGDFYFTVGKGGITSGFLELLLFDTPLKIVPCYNEVKMNPTTKKCKKVIEMIQEHRENGGDIFQFQTELIEKGYGEYL